MPVSLSTAFAHGAAADRPAASSETEGFFYFSEDTGDFAQIQGGVWVTVAAASGGGSSALLYTEVTLDDATMRTFPTAHTTLIAEQGVGTLLIPVHIVVRRNTTFVPYADFGLTTLRLWWGDVGAVTFFVAEDLLMGGETVHFWSLPTIALGTTDGDRSNQPLQVDDGDNSDPYTLGDAGNTLLFGIWYRVVTLPA